MFLKTKNNLSSNQSLKLDCEVGIASNRGSALLGEYVPKSSTHRPSLPWELIRNEVESFFRLIYV